MNTVDVIGTDSICKLIRQSKLSKFIVFKQGAMRGAVPVYRCEDTKSIEGATQCFKDWADSILRENPHNNLPYELFLYSAKMSSDEINAEVRSRKGGKNDDDIDERDDLRTKRDRIRFSFSLKPYNNYGGANGGGLSATEISGIITDTLDKREQANELKALREEVRAYRSGKKRRDDEDEEEEEANENSGLDKVFRVLKELNRAALIKKGKYAEAAGDEEEDEGDDDDLEEEELEEDGEEEEEEDGESEEEEEEEEEKPKNKLTGDQKKKLERMKLALKTLWKYDKNLDRDLAILANIAKKKPGLFKTYISGLRNLNF